MFMGRNVVFYTFIFSYKNFAGHPDHSSIISADQPNSTIDQLNYDFFLEPIKNSYEIEYNNNRET